MSNKETGHYSRKHGSDALPDPQISNVLTEVAPTGKLPCAVAFDLAKRLGVSPEDVGRTADLMEFRLVKCQLGLFGYYPKKSIVKPAASVDPSLENAISQALINGRLPCSSAWDIAKTFGLHKMKISSACDALGIRIRPCQLGAF